MSRPTFAVVAAGVVLSGLGWLTVGTASAATKAEREQAAEELVAEALFHEIYGKDAKRSEMLASALEQVPDSAPALWHTGHVRHNKQWVKFDELPELAGEDMRLTAYRRARAQHPPTLQGRLALAQWCAKRDLADRQRAHLTEALEIAPDHQQARRLLGYRLVESVWLSEKEISQAESHARQTAAGLQQWRPQLEEIRKELDHRAQERRRRARERLREIDDPAAVAAIELVFCTVDEPTALLGVETLDQIDGHEAAVALARQAVFSPWPKVREAAAAKLKTRDKHDYVPALLSVLQSPLQSRAALYQSPTGRLSYRHVLFREGEGNRELAVFDTDYYRSSWTLPTRPGNESVEAVEVYRPTGRITRLGRPPTEDEDGPTIRRYSGESRSVDYQAIVQRDAAARALAVEMAVARQNAMVWKLNEGVFRVLSETTGAIVFQTPESWWNWWNEYNEVYVPDHKPLWTAYRHDGTDVPVWISQPVSCNLKVVKFTCLAAGTPVWTESGPMAIEKIRVGDRVLSQDIESGELVYKPVLRTTVRPPVQLMKFDAGSETIVCTGGHPFWICGDGWIMARHLAPGTRLHGVTGTGGVASLEEAHKAPAHNLVVADFHTYFVGEARILSHDNTIRRPTSAIVPGLASR